MYTLGTYLSLTAIFLEVAYKFTFRPETMPSKRGVLHTTKEVNEFLSQFAWIDTRERVNISSKYFDPLIKKEGKIRVTVERIRNNQPKVDRWAFPLPKGQS